MAISIFQTGRFYQQCRNGKLEDCEIQLLNQLLDRQMQEKSVCLLPSQRTQRAENLKKKLMPRAVAVFPVSIRKRD